nr:putative threonine rich protein [Mycolicibacterium malmesburyense]
MSMRATSIAYPFVAAVAALLLAGCGSESSDTNTPTATAGDTGAQVEVGNTINYGSFGTTADIDCADGKSLNIGGSNNTLTVKGTCANVNIGGADNKVTFDRIDKEISVVGLNNTVTYKDGDPNVNDTGNNNKISKG